MTGNNKLNNDSITDRLDFILAHFNQERPLFPRNIMTKKLGYQKEVFSKEETLTCFKESNLLDCRINAFPSHTEYHGIQRYPPDFIFIDIDRSNFKTEKALNLALSITIKNIKEKLDDKGYPTVLKTGGGYHIYQPVNSFMLEDIKDFTDLTDIPSKDFLRFAKDYLSNGKADKNSNPSFKSALLRIPYSINSKYNNEVTIIDRWDGYRPTIKHLLLDFKTWLIDRKIKQEIAEEKRRSSRNREKYFQKDNQQKTDFIPWIEKLLRTPIKDYRKSAVNLILSSYLVNIKNKSYDESFIIMKGWLDGCNELKRLNFDDKYLIKYSINTALKKKILPMKQETLKERNYELYQDLLFDHEERK
jgi:hypothetical protein